MILIKPDKVGSIDILILMLKNKTEGQRGGHQPVDGS